MFIRCSRFLSLTFLPTVYCGHVLLPLLLRNEWLILSVAHVNASWDMSKRAWVHEFALLTPQRHAATILGIKFLHHVHLHSFLAVAWCGWVKLSKIWKIQNVRENFEMERILIIYHGIYVEEYEVLIWSNGFFAS